MMGKYFFDRDPSKRVFLLYGKKGGTFFCDDLQERGIEEYLSYFLRNSGFDTVSFYNSDCRLYCFDEKSALHCIHANRSLREQQAVQAQAHDEPSQVPSARSESALDENEYDEFEEEFEEPETQYMQNNSNANGDSQQRVRYAEVCQKSSLHAYLKALLNESAASPRQSKPLRHAVVFDGPNMLYDENYIRDNETVFEQFCNRTYNESGSIIIFLTTEEDIISNEGQHTRLRDIYRGYFLDTNNLMNDTCCIMFNEEQRDEIINYLKSKLLHKEICFEENACSTTQMIENLADEIVYCRSVRQNWNSHEKQYTYLFQFLNQKIAESAVDASPVKLSKEKIDEYFELLTGKQEYNEMKKQHGWENVAEVLDPIMEAGIKASKERSAPDRGDYKQKRYYVRRLAGEFEPDTNGLQIPCLAITGPPGTGKTTIGRFCGAALKQAKYLESGHVHEVSAADLISPYIGQTYTLVTRALDMSEGGVLFIDEAGQLAVDETNENHSYNKDALNTLIHALTDPRRHFCLIVAGYPDQIQKLLDSDDGFARRVANRINIEAFSDEVLYDIFCDQLEQKHILLPEKESDIKQLKSMFEAICRVEKDNNFGNAGGVQNIVNEIYNHVVADNRVRMKLEDLGNYLFYTDQYIMECTKGTLFEDWLDSYMQKKGLQGLEYIREQLIDIKNNLRANPQDRFENYNFILLGPSGVGKTTVARLIGKALVKLGIRKRNQFVPVTKEDIFVSSYVNEAKDRINEKLHEAHGGVLFFDEAYQLLASGSVIDQDGSHHGDTRGTDVLDAMMHAASPEGDQAGVSIILAGYEEEMQPLISYNKGFESRFPKHRRIHLKAYDTSVLLEMFEKKSGGQIKLDKRAERYLIYTIEMAKVNPNYGNARYIENLISQIKKTVQGSRETITAEQLHLIMFPHFKSDLEQFKTALEKNFTGIYEVDAIKNKLIEIYRDYNDSLRFFINKQTICINDEALNFLIMGKPGSGKTTMRDAISNSLQDAGLRNGKIVKRDAHDFLGSYNVSGLFESAIQEAEGGILFIDECHNLGGNEPFLVALLKYSELYRTSTTIILAGYDDETTLATGKRGMLEGLICRDAGLSRRFPEKLRINLTYTSRTLAEVGVKYFYDTTEGKCDKTQDELFKADLAKAIAHKAETPGVFIRNYCIPALRNALRRNEANAEESDNIDIDLSADFDFG